MGRSRRSEWIGVVLLLSVIAVAIGYAVSDEGAPEGAGRPVSPVTTAQKLPLAVFIGDSYTGGSTMNSSVATTWPALLSRAERWRPGNWGVGGSGYTIRGLGTTTFRERVPVILRDLRPDIVFIWSSRNDIASAAKVGQEAQATFRELRVTLPRVPVVVIGPCWPKQAAPPLLVQQRDVVRSAARAAGLPFIDPIEDRWFQGTNATLIGADGVHPTDAGHRYIARLVQRDLAALGVDAQGIKSPEH